MSNDNSAFYLNGQRHELTQDNANLLLVDYLRSPAVGLTGTKHSCGQGGCGSCAVMLTVAQPNGETESRAINACLRPLWMLANCAITTIEGVGNTRDGLAPEQYQIAKGNGSQCGYCTPGFVMNLYALRRQYPSLNRAQIEHAFDGNICRCTGFRPILEAASHFASDATVSSSTPCIVEPDLIVRASDKGTVPTLKRVVEDSTLQFAQGNFYRPATTEQLRQLIKRNAGRAIEIVAGHTSVGIPELKTFHGDVFIEVSHIEELQRVYIEDEHLHIGAATRYSDLIDVLETLRQSQPKRRRRALGALRYMSRRTAGTIVRNVATIGGNTMLVARNASSGGTPFPSDLVTALLTLNAYVSVLVEGHAHHMMLREFLAKCQAEQGFCDTAVLLEYRVPLTKKHEFAFVSKVAIREVNAHAIVNSGLALHFNGQSIEQATLVFGALAPLPFRALKTELVLESEPWSTALVERALTSLDREIAKMQSRLPEWYMQLPDNGYSNRYKRRLAVSQLRKHLLRMGRKPSYRIFGKQQAVTDLYHRPLVKGSQHFAPSNHPSLGQPIIKLSAFEQAAGEASYVHDMHVSNRGVYGAFATSTAAQARFAYQIPGAERDVDKALLLDHLKVQFAEHFVDLVDISDVPTNGAVGKGYFPTKDPWFALDEVINWGQPIALVLADSQQDAEAIAQYVTQECIAYEQIAEPLLSIDEAVAADRYFANYAQDPSHIIQSPEFAGNDGWVTQEGKITFDGKPCLVVRGKQNTSAQKQFYMEPQSALVTPGEGRKLHVKPSSQDPKGVHLAIAHTLNLSENLIEVTIDRIGGGYGGKTTRSPYVAVPAAIAAHKLNRPVLVALPRDTDSAMIGNRHAFRGDYCMLVVRKGPDKGRILGMATQHYSNGGSSIDCSFTVMDCAQIQADGTYNIRYFSTEGKVCHTQIPSSNAMRSFGVIQSQLILEDGIEAAANALDMAPDALRALNFYEQGDTTPYGQRLDYCLMTPVWQRIKQRAQFSERQSEIKRFNATHRWRKRGLCVMPMKYGLGYNLGMIMQGSALIDVYVDGTIALRHTGVEMGQGVNTKVAQIAANALNVPLELIEPFALDTTALPNPTVSGGTSTTELSGGATLNAANQQRERLEQLCYDLLAEHGSKWCKKQGINFWDYAEGWRAKHADHLIWHNVINQAYQHRVNLASQANFATSGLTDLGQLQFYGFTYSAACSEVEIDVLTGETLVRRTDIVYDMGESLNPAIDIGQIEGGFVMGLGNVTSEELVFQQTGPGRGRLNTPNTWHYKPPASTSIPRIFNVDLFPRDDAAEIPRNPNLLMSSKGVGEPPTVLAASVFFAIKHAILAARQDAGLGGDWFSLDAPATPQRVQAACLPAED